MTVFPDGSKERLHGHNYHLAVELELRDGDFANMIPFSDVKKVMTEICEDWKEYVLLPGKNPYFELIGQGAEVEFKLCGARYVLPDEDVKVLPVENVSVEGLAMHVWDLMAEKTGTALRACGVTSMLVRISETPGQGASFEAPLQ